MIVMHNQDDNDYTCICNDCGSEEVCDHEFGLDKSLTPIHQCYECCERCEREAYISKQGVEHTQGLIKKDLLLDERIIEVCKADKSHTENLS
jgi:hypothetical protein